MRSLLRTLLLLPLLILAGCGSAQLGSANGDIKVIAAKALPPPARADLLAANRPYLIGAFDKLKIDVFGIDDLQKEVQIDASGRLSFPLIGVVEASGRTPGELAELIELRLQGRFVRDPQVIVNLVETVSQLITVDGQVKRPGLYPVIGRLTLMRAVATAGGAAEFAKLSDVILFRTVEGQKLVGLYNLKGIRRGNYEDPEVFANDVIVVGDSQARRIFKDIISGSSLLTTPLVILTR